MGDWEEVKKLHSEGVSIRKIARKVKISRNTVRRWIKLDEKPSYTRKAEYPTKIDEYKKQIKEWYLEHGYIGAKIHRELKKDGYDGSVNPIYRYLKILREKREENGKK